MSIATTTPKSNQLPFILKILWVAMAVVGGWGLFQIFTNTSNPVGFSSSIPWGVWVAAYMYFCGLSAGAFFLAAWARFTKNAMLLPIVRPCVLLAFTSLIMGLLSIISDLGHIERAFSVFFRPQFHSVMAWLVWFYTAYFVVLAMLLVRKSSPTAAGSAEKCSCAAVSGGIFALVIAAGPGLLLSTLIAREYWHTALYPLFFMLGGITTAVGCVAAMAAWLWPGSDAMRNNLLGKLRTYLIALVCMELLFTLAEYLTPLWYGIGKDTALMQYVLFGPYWYVFWVFQVFLGILLPLALLIYKKTPMSTGLAGALVALMFFAVRVNLVVPGLVTPPLQGLDMAYTDPVGNSLSYLYVPTWFEWQVLIGIIAVGMAVWHLGCKFLPAIFPHFSQTDEVNI